MNRSMRSARIFVRFYRFSFVFFFVFFFFRYFRPFFRTERCPLRPIFHPHGFFIRIGPDCTALVCVCVCAVGVECAPTS
jgi:hypothetical protein